MNKRVMAKRDYYDILGIDKGADGVAIKRAYRGLAMKYHPDRNPGDAPTVEKMKEINEAYAVLCDPEKRRLYDTYGHAGLQGFTQEDIFRRVDFGSLFEEFFGEGFGFGESIFDGFFGRRRAGRARQPRRGADLRYDLAVDLEDVVFGKEEKIEISKVEACFACNGAGAKKDGLKECEACHGSGQLITEQRSGFTVFRQITTCGQCRGRGKVIVDPCDECEGKGSVEKRKEIDVYIPRGADTGYRIRIEGEGEPGEDRVGSGDLYIVLKVEKHPIFERHGDDIYLVKEIDLPQAALGGELNDIPGLEGDLKLDIPQGTQSGALFRIINKGIPHLNDYGRGDEYVVVKVVTPTDLSEEEKELLRKFEQLRKQRS
ncbi:MAG: molecular chaperone DnaJ [Dehalococcoidia bacterium]|nr:MAG: molecular chaperone DnaJ [Dehalococcoidia bacterium]